MIRRLFLLGSTAATAAGCSPLALFDTFAPRDPARRVVADASYGPHPRQRLDVYAPPSTSGSFPIAVFFYGGSWKSGRKEDYGFAAAALASAGCLTVLPDYRLYPEVRFPAFLDDGAVAVRWARDNARRLGGDPDRIVLVGHSAGAYNAAMLALDPRYLTRAGVPMSSVRALAGLSGPYDFLPLDAGTAQEVFGEAPNLAATQPVTFAHRDAPPAFLATGDRDDTVRPRNTASLAAKLRLNDVTVEERSYPEIAAELR